MEAMSQLDMFPNLKDEQKEFVSNLATMKDGRVGFDLPKDMAKQLGITNLVDGFVGIDQLGSDQIAALQRIQVDNEKMSTKEIARGQLNNTTQIMGTVSAIYLRLMEDTRTSKAGVAVGGKMDLASQFMKDNFDPANMSTGEMTKLSIEMAKKGMQDSAEAMYETLKNTVGPEVSDVLEQGMKKAKETYNEYAPQGKELLEKGIDKTKEIYREVKDFFGELTVKVDINSNSSELAGIIVSEISRNPQLRADLASNIVKNTKNYT